MKNHTLGALITDMQRELTFYNELNIVKTSKAFKVYAWSYSVEVKDSKDPLV